ncbi:MAG TPA: reactive intermediate/imine deaminase [Candidatus Hydrogenedentes bacterium]|nr:reactive intermediate/imine deaminase [Candidatus Hydrogenedentota bacterium]HIJ74330.1 reactive intermediate/imine deaminase [Candidatus Hydrogenedentota bacterium]
MEKRCISVQGAPPVQGPYSHAVAAGNLLFVSGQGPFAPDGSGVVRGAIEGEARLALSNLRAVIEGAGSDLAHVVKVTVYLQDLADFGAFNEVYKEFFSTDCPARSCIQAARLPLDIQVEVDAIAILP